MIITLDPTQADMQTLTVDDRELSWFARDDRAGTRLIAELQRLNLSVADELRVVTGPGSFTNLRVAALVTNAVSHETGVRLFARTAEEVDFRPVKIVVPHYGGAPRITPPKDTSFPYSKTKT